MVVVGTRRLTAKGNAEEEEDDKYSWGLILGILTNICQRFVFWFRIGKKSALYVMYVRTNVTV